MKSVSVAVLECANDLLKAKKNKSRLDYNAIFVKLTDAGSLLGHVNHELVGKTRKSMKPHLKEEYRPLCTADIPIGKLLFGEDLAKELGNAKEMSHCSNIVQNFSQPTLNTRRSQGHRFHPFFRKQRQGQSIPAIYMTPKSQRSSFKKQWRC